jgi:hypothetical protein
LALADLDRKYGLAPDPQRPRGLAALDRKYRVGMLGALPHEDIEEATGMELDEPRGPMDYLRRAAAAALGGPASVLDLQETGLRALLPAGPIGDVAVRGVTGATDTLLNKADEFTGLPLSRASQDSAQADFINSGTGGSPVMDALADTAAHAAGLAADPANFLPGAAAAKPVVAAAPDLARAADLLMPAAREVVERLNVIRPPELPFQYNLGRIDIDEPAQQEFRSLLSEHIDAVQAQRRAGEGGWDRLGAPERLANKLGLTPEKLMRTKAGTAFNDEELAVLDSTLGSVGQKMQELARVVASGDDSSLNKAALGRLREQYVALMKVSVGAGTEAGRALNSLKALKPAMDADTATRLSLLRQHGKSMSDDQINALAALDPNNPDELFSFLRHFDKPKMGDYVHEAWMSSILSGPGSMERNLIGNSLFAAMEIPVRAARSLVDIPMSALQGRERELFMGEVMPAMMGALRGIPKGTARALSILKRGYDDPEIVGKLVPPRSSWDRSPNAAVRALSPAVTMPLRVLSATDAVFRSMAHGAETYAQATRMAIKEGLDGDDLASRVAELVQSPTTEMLEAAKRYERFSTFTDEMSPLGQLIGKARGVVPGARYIIPFVQVADRLAARGFEFTPWGLVKAAKRGGSEASDLTARATIGSAVMAGFAAYAMDGKVTGAPPMNPGERDLFYRAGKQPYSVKVGDRWVPFSYLEPLSTPLTLTATMMDSFRNKKELPTEQKVLSAVAGVAKSLVNKTYMQGVADLFEAIERGQSSPDAVIDLGARQAGGFMPYSALSRSVAMAQDPRVVRTDTLGQRMAANVPGLRDNLPGRVDLFGEDVVPATGAARGFLPFVPTKETNDPVALALEEAGVSMSFVSNQLGGEELSTEQRDEYQRIVGRETRKRLERVVMDPQWWLLDKERKAKRLERAIYLGRQRGRTQMLKRTRSMSN